MRAVYIRVKAFLATLIFINFPACIIAYIVGYAITELSNFYSLPLNRSILAKSKVIKQAPEIINTENSAVNLRLGYGAAKYPDKGISVITFKEYIKIWVKLFNN